MNLKSAAPLVWRFLFAMKPKDQNIYDLKQARNKIQAYCAYQERCQKEVREKLVSWGIIPLVIDELMVELIQQNFLNEERYAISFARGKYRFKKWGKRKIEMELKMRDISAYCINKAMAELDQFDYTNQIAELAEKYMTKQKGEHLYFKKRKTAAYLIRKGYESHLVWEVLNNKYPG